MMRLVGILAATAAFLSLLPAVGIPGEPAGRQQQKSGAANNLDRVMKKKLTHTQKLLEGIALNDFGTIRDNAEELIALSKQAEWMTLRTPEYELFTDSFRRSAQELEKAAKNKNLDGAALAYVDLTMTCVKCHKYVRDTRRTQLTPLSERVFAANAR